MSVGAKQKTQGGFFLAAALPLSAALTLSAALLAGCASLVERTGRLLDGSARAYTVTAVYRAPDGNVEVRRVTGRDTGAGSLVILPAAFPAVQIRAGEPDDAGVFVLVALDFLGGNEYGWNDFTLDLFGAGRLVPGDGEEATFEITGFEALDISAGRIRRHDVRVSGADALGYLRNRHERIAALADWMGGTGPQALTDRAGFERYWRPVLFPEIVRRRDRPDGWHRSGDVFVRAGDVGWNTGYTERLFPYYLRPVRDSGTLLRDWEEAADWIRLQNGWDDLVKLLSAATVLVRVR